MKKISKILSVFLCVVILLGVAPAFDISALTVKASGYYAGQHIYFGEYPQSAEITDLLITTRVRQTSPDKDNNRTYNGKKYRIINDKVYEILPIEWRVLDTSSDGVLMISEKILENRQWNSYTNITYAESEIREWLNTTFYNTAFTASERAKINSTRLKNDRGSNTTDKVFLLLDDEARNTKYFKNDSDRVAYRTAYVGGGTGWWWLRSQSGNSYGADYVKQCPHPR